MDGAPTLTTKLGPIVYEEFDTEIWPVELVSSPYPNGDVLYLDL
jgi:hypothetical protein